MIKSCWKPLALSVLTLSLLSACNQKSNENNNASSTAVSASATGNGVTVSINTARGEMAVPENPSKVVVFDMATLDDLQALKVPVAGAPKKVLVPYLQQTLETVNNIGTLFEPDMEALHALKPQLIIISGRTAPKYDELAALAPTMDMSDSGQDLIGDGLKMLDSYGKLFKKEAEAKKLHDDIQNLLAETQQAVKGKGTGLILMVNAGKLSAFGSSSRFGWIHTQVGVPVADTSIPAAPHGQSVSFEYVQKINPDWLFVIDRTAAIGEEGKTAQAVLNNDLVRQSKAWKENHVVYLSSASYLAAGGVQQMKTDLTNIKAAFTH
ncbi:siderophore ABC transporter substrate-binding protein [Snodgrassella alvi]|uniref:siderophore ABC transporter substrate-binding protein n=1 Tax=Snodgrassella alvi TaxID=1196083 RepID=UPI000C1F2ABA|nr:siderophore ABC transporter substrate-binding protein [Snodgrassella alvi]